MPQEYLNANSYVIMNEEEYKEVWSKVLGSENFPKDPPCGFPMIMVKIAIQDSVPSPTGGLYKILTSWIGIPAESLRKILFPYMPGKAQFGPIEFTDVGVKTGRFKTDKKFEPGDQVLVALQGLAKHSREMAGLWNTVKDSVGNALKQASDGIATEMFTLLEENGYEIVKKGGTSVADKAINLIASNIPRPQYTTAEEWAINLAQMLIDQNLRCNGNWNEIQIMKSGIVKFEPE